MVSSERQRRVRNATISENGQIPDMEESVASISSLIVSGEYLETKRQIEQLRKQYGEKWLHQDSGSLVQDVLGLEKTPMPMTSTPNLYEQEFLLHARGIDITAPERNEVTSEQSTNNTFTTATDSAPSEDGVYGEDSAQLPEPPISDDDILCEGEENLYLATVKGDSEPVFIVLTDTHIWERECTSGNERTRWPLETLLSCEAVGTENRFIRLEFDTVRRDRRERQYELEEETERLSKVLNSRLSTRPPQTSKLIVYHCMKCSTQFTQEKSLRKRDSPSINCPACDSHLVIEDDQHK